VAKIADILRQGTSVSFEFFPPRTDEAEVVLARTLVELEPLHPSFVSVTYGAGGVTRERTHDLVVEIERDTPMTAMAHLTCVGHTQAELTEIVIRYRDAGIENILALGGDLPDGPNAVSGELEYAIELVHLIQAAGDFSVGVAAHPEPHPRSLSREQDRDRGAEKLSEADFAITQFFFEAHHYFDLVEDFRSRGITTPIIPGIMPVLSIAGTKRMTELQGSEFPSWFMSRLLAVEEDPTAVRALGIEESTRLCQELLAGGAPGLHFFTLNRSTATREIASNLGLPKRS